MHVSRLFQSLAQPVSSNNGLDTQPSPETSLQNPLLNLRHPEDYFLPSPLPSSTLGQTLLAPPIPSHLQFGKFNTTTTRICHTSTPPYYDDARPTNPPPTTHPEHTNIYDAMAVQKTGAYNSHTHSRHMGRKL